MSKYFVLPRRYYRKGKSHGILDIYPRTFAAQWGVTAARAKALRTGRREPDPEGVVPTWPWSLDQTERGTAGFRSVKFNVYEATMIANGGTGVRVHSNADLHVRPCLADGAVLMHVLSRCPLGQVVIKCGDRLTGEVVFELVGP